MNAIARLILLVLSLCFIAISSNQPTDFSARSGESTAEVKKKAFSDLRRIVFFAGLEGTGHHNWKNLFERCIRRFPDSCKNYAAINDALFEIFYRGKRFGIWSSEDADHAAERNKRAEEAFWALSKTPLSGAELFMIGLDHCGSCGMMSYPNFVYQDRALDHPDISQLAGYAERNALDLRIVVLMRSARQILESTVRRGFGLTGLRRGHHRHHEAGFSKTPLVLVANADALYTQLSMLDPAFFICVQHEEFSDLLSIPKGSRKSFSYKPDTPSYSLFGQQVFPFIHPEVLAPRNVSFLSQLLVSSKLLSKHSNEVVVDVKERMIEEWIDIFEPMLASRLLLIEELCNKSSAMRTKT